MPAGLLAAVGGGAGAAAAGATLLGAGMQASAARSASRAQTDAANRQIDLQREIYDDQTARFAPFLGAGQNALQAYQSELGLGAAPMIDGQQYQGMSMSPAAQFALGQGVDSIQSSAAARGGLRSGNALQALEQMRFGLAAGDRDNQMNRLLGLANMGQNSAGMQAQAGSNFAAGASNALANLGDAQAAGAIGRGNAWNQGLGNLAGIFNYQRNLVQ